MRHVAQHVIDDDVQPLEDIVLATISGGTDTWWRDKLAKMDPATRAKTVEMHPWITVNGYIP